MLTSSEQRTWPWYVWGILLVTVAVLVRVGVGAWTMWRPAPPAPASAANVASDATQTNEGGQVTIKATWCTANATPMFNVVMDTHAVDLDSYDLSQLAVLKVDGREVQPVGWDAPKGGHHRQGTLSFPATAADGTALVGSETRAITLIIRDIAGVPKRVFQWTR